MKAARGGDEKWQEKHLPADAKIIFKDEVIPRLRYLLGTLEPWTPLTPEHVQTVIDTVFVPERYKAAKDEVFFNLVRYFNYVSTSLTSFALEAKARMETWRNGFSQAAVQTVKSLIDDNAEILTTPADVKDLINQYLSKIAVTPGTDNETYAYQWAKWADNGAERKASTTVGTILCTDTVFYCRAFVKIPLSSGRSQSHTSCK
jgi:hypothetical protein